MLANLDTISGSTGISLETIIAVLVLGAGFVGWILAQQARAENRAEIRHAESRKWAEDTFLRGETFREYRLGMDEKVDWSERTERIEKSVRATFEIVRDRLPSEKDRQGRDPR